jgi:hypothetical protein
MARRSTSICATSTSRITRRSSVSPNGEDDEDDDRDPSADA